LDHFESCRLQRPERRHDRIEEQQQPEDAILVDVESSVARLVAFAADVAQSVEQRQQLVKRISDP
jgi:hypothetical protein